MNKEMENTYKKVIMNRNYVFSRILSIIATMLPHAIHSLEA